MGLGLLALGCAGAEKKKGSLQYPYRAVIKTSCTNVVLVTEKYPSGLSPPKPSAPVCSSSGKVYALILNQLPKMSLVHDSWKEFLK